MDIERRKNRPNLNFKLSLGIKTVLVKFGMYVAVGEGCESTFYFVTWQFLLLHCHSLKAVLKTFLDYLK